MIFRPINSGARVVYRMALSATALAGVRFIVGTSGTSVNQRFAAQTPNLHTLLAVQLPAVRVGSQVIYDLDLLP